MPSFAQECRKLIQTLLYTGQFLCHFLVECVWHCVLKGGSLDDVLDQLAFKYEHAHPVERITRRHKFPSWIRNYKSGLHAATDEIKSAILFPKNKDELISIVSNISNGFRVIGSGHCWRGLLDTNTSGDVLISLAKMNNILSVQVVGDKRRVTVQAGIKLHELTRTLEKQFGLALPNMGNYDRQSLGGAIVGGTHGTSGSSGLDTFTRAIVELKMITAEGRDITLTKQDSVTYGVGGILYECTLEVQDFYYLEAKHTILQNPSRSIDFTTWLSKSAAERLWVRWAYPGRPHQVCELIEYTKTTSEKEYNVHKNRMDRLVDVWTLGGCNALPEFLHEAAPNMMHNKMSVDKYYYQLNVPLIPHIIGLEYAVPIAPNLNEIVDKIPASLNKLWECFDMVQLDFRVTPPDEAKGHITHSDLFRDGVIWCGLYVGLPPSLRLGDADFRHYFEEYETLMIQYKGVAHPHKYAVSARALPAQTIQYVQKFQQQHDPRGKMMNNAALKELLSDS